MKKFNIKKKLIHKTIKKIKLLAKKIIISETSNHHSYFANHSCFLRLDFNFAIY